MNTKQKHLEYLREKGPFALDCSAVIFGTDELELLHQWGHWFQALQDDVLQPFTELQLNFIAVCRGEREAVSVEEKTWKKYLFRKSIEAKWGERMHLQYEYREEGFYTRDMKKQLNRMMYAELRKNHRM